VLRFTMTCASALRLLVNSAATSSNGTLPTGPTDDDHNNPTLIYQSIAGKMWMTKSLTDHFQFEY
jgi:hypothetical protein